MAQIQSASIKAGFKYVKIFKDQVVGVGSYGMVYKAKCDDLVCAAKILHPTLLDPTESVPHLYEHRRPIRRFEQECEFLRTLRHPNIVQYTGTFHYPDTGMPVLLMELLEENLTIYLERCSQPVPYHLQVNICHSVASALSYLHANDIVHRDISGNNILVAINSEVIKVGDFGMSAINISNRDDLTMCPDFDVYMPPEAVTDNPRYTEKIDCFSFGVVVIQVLTKIFPKPGDRRKYINDPSVEYAVAVDVPEIERRQNHISKIDPRHPLLPIALDCLKDEDVERPTAHKLCKKIETLKESEGYIESKNVSEADLKISQLEQQLVQSQEELKKVEKKLTQQLHGDQLNSMLRKRELTQAKQQVSDLQQRVSQSQTELAQARQQVSDLQQRAFQSQTELTQARQQISDLQQRALQNKTELTQARRLIFDLSQQIHAEQQRAKQSQSELTQVRQQVTNLQQQIRTEEQRATLSQTELTQARQQVTDLQQQIHAAQQRALQSQSELTQARQQISRERDQLLEKDMRIRDLERRHKQFELETLGSRVTGLQLLPQGDSWNISRTEVQIIEQIGYGAAGLVSKGRFQGQEVAVKQIHREILQEKHILDEFKREVGIMATIQHPNLVRFIAAVFDDRVNQHLDSPLLILELLRTNLRDAYKKYDLGPSKSMKSVPIFRDIAYGLHYLHEHSEPIIHRDVSAPNILLESLPGNMWRAKLSDFGSANFLKRAKTLGVGAIVYTAPEMFPREGPSAPMPRPTTKCDVFSYGIVVVEVITKTMPTAENRHQLFGEVERKWRLMHGLVSQCTEVSPHARPTMADILNTLNRIPTARQR